MNILHVITPTEVKKFKDYSKVKGIILSGGPSSVTKQISKYSKYILLKIFQYLAYVTVYS